LFGVEKGIEKVSKFMMPVLVVLTLFIAIYTMTIDGAWDGVIYYIKPDFSKFSVKTVLAAMGQLFYSMSLAMGIMITYGSYMKKDVRVEESVRQIEIFDTGIAFLAGLMVIPGVFAFSGGTPESLGAGPGLMFVTLPKVFDSFKGGHILGAVFFLLVLLAALTSSISLAETIVAPIQEKFGISRTKACLIVLAGCVIIGLPSTLGFGLWSDIKPLGMDILSFFDFVSNSIIMPILAFITCIFVGYVIKPEAIGQEVEEGGFKFKSRKLFYVMIKYVAPVFILLILVSSVLDGLGIVKM
jgi:NSS family neurotransmitter:Na+ symporter